MTKYIAQLEIIITNLLAIQWQTITGSHIETVQLASWIGQKMVNDKSIVLYNCTINSRTWFLRERPHPSSPSLTGVELVIW